MNDEALMRSLRECFDEWLNDPAAQADYQKWLDKLNSQPKETKWDDSLKTQAAAISVRRQPDRT